MNNDNSDVNVEKKKEKEQDLEKSHNEKKYDVPAWIQVRDVDDGDWDF